ncbi:MAG: hypothetical protein GY861_21650 [bacterium]|nr:hypothetical protein [bacterium]
MIHVMKLDSILDYSDFLDGLLTQALGENPYGDPVCLDVDLETLLEFELDVEGQSMVFTEDGECLAETPGEWAKYFIHQPFSYPCIVVFSDEEVPSINIELPLRLWFFIYPEELKIPSDYFESFD